MVNPDPNQRYNNANLALEALEPLFMTRLPEVRLSQSTLNFRATRISEKLTKTIIISNSIPETILQGKWQVAPYFSDLPHTPDTQAWISFSPREFEGNETRCKITVDTSKLQMDEVYERQILLHTNSALETYTLKVRIQTAPRSVSVEVKKIPYGSLLLLLSASFATVAWVEVILFYFRDAFQEYVSYLGRENIVIELMLQLIGGTIGVPIGAGFGWLIGYAIDTVCSINNKASFSCLTSILGVSIGFGSFFFSTSFFDNNNSLAIAGGMLDFVLLVGSWLVIIASDDVYYQLNNHHEEYHSFAVLLTRLTAGFGLILGIGFWFSFSNPFTFLILALATTGLLLAMIYICPNLK